jgi:hypothetical protein
LIWRAGIFSVTIPTQYHECIRSPVSHTILQNWRTSLITLGVVAGEGAVLAKSVGESGLLG